MDKPIKDCNLNNPPPNVDRSDNLVTETGFRFSFHLREFCPDYIVWFVTLGTQQTWRENGAKDESDIHGVLTKTSVRTWAFLQVFLYSSFKNNKQTGISSFLLHSISSGSWRHSSNNGKKASGALQNLSILVLKKRGSQAPCRCCLISF